MTFVITADSPALSAPLRKLFEDSIGSSLQVSYVECTRHALHFDFHRLALKLLPIDDQAVFKYLAKEYTKMSRAVLAEHRTAARNAAPAEIYKLAQRAARKLQLIADSLSYKNAAMFSLLYNRRYS